MELLMGVHCSKEAVVAGESGVQGGEYTNIRAAHRDGGGFQSCVTLRWVIDEIKVYLVTNPFRIGWELIKLLYLKRPEIVILIYK